MKMLAVGPNPAYQKSLEFPTFSPHEVNRATSVGACAGGKGIHFARAVNRLSPETAVIAQLLGGDTGRAIHRWSEADAPQLVTWTEAATRTCTTVLCRQSNRMTELIEPTGPLSQAESDAFRQLVLDACDDSDAIGLCGTFQPELGTSFYADVAKRNPRATVLLDGYRGVGDVLDTGHVDVLKLNDHEVRTLAGEADLQRAAAVCMRRWSPTWLGVTAGGAAAYLFGPNQAWVFEVPPLEVVANPIGAGDTVSAVFLLRLMQQYAPQDAFAAGLAAATASCTSMIGADFQPDDLPRRLAHIQISPLQPREALA